MITGNEWLTALASELGVETPDKETVEALLEIARISAHGSERWAAPVSCYLAAKARVPLTEVLEASQVLASAAEPESNTNDP